MPAMALTAEQRDWITLALVPGVGTANFIKLLARFRTPRTVLDSSVSALSEVVKPALAKRIAQYADLVDIAAQERAIEAHGVQVITMEDSAYPLRLAEIYDPPLVLFVRGELRESDSRCVAMVGTRRASPYGTRMAEQLAKELAAQHVTVVSGLASGIDAVAHRGAIQAGGRTIAVLGCGVDVTYPRENAELMEAITRHGCVISQFPMGAGPSRGNFPYRNRIISGLCQGTLIVEAPESSGALITARQAADQGREVFAVPGQVGMRNSAGPHRLIQEGAKLVQNANDILVELEMPEAAPLPHPEPPPQPDSKPQQKPAMAAPKPAPTSPPPRTPEPTPSPRPQLSSAESQVLDALAPNGSYVDEIAMACKVSISEALSSLTLLELKGLVRQFSGKRFAPR